MSHPYGLLSLLPPIVAIALAILTRKAVWSLFAGLLVGALLMRQGNPIAAVHDLFEVHLWPTLVDPGKLRVFSFTLLMGGLVGLIIRCGGMKGFVELISPLAKSRRGGQLIAWVMGWVIFFDDYASSILLGNTLRPVCDRLKISREKLAYVVDSTAAPIAGLSLLSTWVAVEIDYIREGLAGMGDPAGFSAVELFVASIPYRFYVLGSLLMVALIAILGRDYGPMLKAERRRIALGDQSQALGGVSAGGTSAGSVEAAGDEFDGCGDWEIKASHWFNAMAPIGVTVAVVIALIYATGVSALADDNVTDGPFALREIVGAADSSVALQYGSLAGLVVAVLLCRAQRLLPTSQIIRAIQQGAAVVIPAIAILWCASALSRMTGDRDLGGAVSLDESGRQTFSFRDHRLYTGEYLAGVISGNREASDSRLTTLKLLPTITFLLAGIVSFCTGTSFGTMGMLTPLVMTLSHNLLTSSGEAVTPDNPLFLAVLGSVLAGAVFGDHCSPISDTTILSSQACGCDHIAHVMTQMPYALTLATVAIVLGTLPIGFGVSPLVLLPLQAIALVTVLMIFGRKP